MARAGIWLQYDGGDNYHRLHTGSVIIGEVKDSSENMVRPVIEIPMSALDGFINEERYTI